MDLSAWGSKVMGLIKKFRYPILVLIIGLVLISLPGKIDTPAPSDTVPSGNSVRPNISDELADILGQIKGVGKVQVMLTIAAGENTIYQTDEDSSISESDSTIHKETVIITDSDRNQQALISQVLPPEYLGAIIVCQGADKAEVKLAIVEAVSRATGLGADCISVLKMK